MTGFTQNSGTPEMPDAPEYDAAFALNQFQVAIKIANWRRRWEQQKLMDRIDYEQTGHF